MMTAKILVVDDMRDTTDSLIRFLKKAGYNATPAYSEHEANKYLTQDAFDVIVTDMMMEKPDSGLEVLREAKKLDPGVEVLILTAYGEVDTAVPAMNFGAYDYIKKIPEGLSQEVGAEVLSLSGRSPKRDIYDTVLDRVKSALMSKMICDNFDPDEVAVICLFLGFDYNELPRDSKRDKVVHMIKQLSQSNELHLLESVTKAIRPDLFSDPAPVEHIETIISRIIKQALEYNPSIISDVYNDILETSTEKPNIAELCQALLLNSLKSGINVQHPVSSIEYGSSNRRYNSEGALVRDGIRDLPYSDLKAPDNPGVSWDESKEVNSLAVLDTRYRMQDTRYKIQDATPDSNNLGQHPVSSILHPSSFHPSRYAFLKIDVAEHSKIVKQHKAELVNVTFDRYTSFVNSQTRMKSGEIWSWQGDGGLCVFNGDDCEDRATLSAVSILTGMRMFNMEQNLLPVDLDVNIAVHAGYVTVTGDRGCIHSDVINFVSHLEESRTEKNTICISTDVFGELSEQIKKRFSPKGIFEGKEIYVYRD